MLCAVTVDPLVRPVRLDLFESLPSRGFAVEPLQQTLQQNRALHRSTTQAPRHAADVELYSSTALQSALQLYSSTALYTLQLHPLHPPSGTSHAPHLRLNAFRRQGP